VAAAPRLAVLISGQGRNLQAILDAVAAGRVPAQVAGVISNRADAPGLARAQRAGVATQVIEHGGFASRTAFDAALGAALDALAPDLIALAGFMRILTDPFIARCRGRLVNIHPSLLPKYPGLNTHRRALADDERTHGASVHFVTEQLDGGPVIVQGAFSVRADDTAESLAERVMQDIELKIYPQALAWLARGDVTLVGDRVHWHGRPLAAPLTMADLEPEFR
jgi:phosphoribosylglycinamide formyltransferase 1